jgi:hypothetical protein
MLAFYSENLYKSYIVSDNIFITNCKDMFFACVSHYYEEFEVKYEYLFMIM